MALSTDAGLTEVPITSGVINQTLGFTPVASNPLAVVALGTPYTLTDVPAAVTFGTISPSLTLNSPGTYLILSRARTKYNAATLAAVRFIRNKLVRTNNSPGDLFGGDAAGLTGIITLLTGGGPDVTWGCLYTTANSDDIISMYSSIDILPSAGSVTIDSASMIAFRLQ